MSGAKIENKKTKGVKKGKRREKVEEWRKKGEKGKKRDDNSEKNEVKTGEKIRKVQKKKR